MTPSAHARALAGSFTPRARKDPSTRTTDPASSTRKTTSARPSRLSESNATTTPENPTESTSALHAGIILPLHGSHRSAEGAGSRASGAVTVPAWATCSLPLSSRSARCVAFRPPCRAEVGARGAKGLGFRPRWPSPGASRHQVRYVFASPLSRSPHRIMIGLAN